MSGNRETPLFSGHPNKLQSSPSTTCLRCFKLLFGLTNGFISVGLQLAMDFRKKRKKSFFKFFFFYISTYAHATKVFVAGRVVDGCGGEGVYHKSSDSGARDAYVKRIEIGEGGMV